MANPSTLGDAEYDSGAKIGDAATVTPCDHGKVPVTGVLASHSDSEIVLHRRAERLGDIAVHVPRLGYRLEPAGQS